jgi:hypothetical protein
MNETTKRCNVQRPTICTYTTSCIDSLMYTNKQSHSHTPVDDAAEFRLGNNEQEYRQPILYCDGTTLSNSFHLFRLLNAVLKLGAICIVDRSVSGTRWSAHAIHHTHD